MATGAASEALAAGWTPQELWGVSGRRPHDDPDHAGLIFNLKPGDTVTDVRRAGAIIAYGTTRHVWKRVPVNGSIVFPWQLGCQP